MLAAGVSGTWSRMIGKEISTMQAASIRGVTDARVRQLIKEKKLAKKNGRLGLALGPK